MKNMGWMEFYSFASSIISGPMKTLTEFFPISAPHWKSENTCSFNVQLRLELAFDKF